MMHGWRLVHKNFTIGLITYLGGQLRLVYKDYNSSFDELLLKGNFFRIHQRNLQKLATEIFKVKLGLASEIMKTFFQ